MTRPEDERDHALKARRIVGGGALRAVLLRSPAGFVAASILRFVFADGLLDVMARPLRDALAAAWAPSGPLFLRIEDRFLADLRLAVLGGLFFALPLAAAQAAGLVAPRFRRAAPGAFRLRRAAAPALFLAGAAVAWFLVAPFAVDGRDPELRGHIDLMTILILAFGLGFVLPAPLTLMGREAAFARDDADARRPAGEFLP